MNVTQALELAGWATKVERLMALGIRWNRAVYHIANTYGLSRHEAIELGRMTKPD